LRTPSGGGLCADPVQKRVPGEKDVAKRGLTPTVPLQKGGQKVRVHDDQGRRRNL
jgi:hypothetical protein